MASRRSRLNDPPVERAYGMERIPTPASQNNFLLSFGSYIFIYPIQHVGGMVGLSPNLTCDEHVIVFCDRVLLFLWFVSSPSSKNATVFCCGALSLR